MTSFFIHPQDVAIIRDEDHPDQARVYDADGEHRQDFPSSWTDEQIHFAIRFANKAYGIGFDSGLEMKAYEIRTTLRKVLGVNEV